MKILTYILLLLAAAVFLLAVIKTGGKVAGLSPNTLLKLVNTFLLGAIATGVLGCANKSK